MKNRKVGAKERNSPDVKNRQLAHPCLKAVHGSVRKKAETTKLPFGCNDATNRWL